jgi:ABC-type multidrug transport system fused ATPase/permease subunit
LNKGSSALLQQAVPQRGVVGFKDATFTWSGDANADDGTQTPSRRNFVLHVDGELFFKRGMTNLIVGPTGSGKTSILMALLGEMHFTPAGSGSWFNLPRDCGIAYAAQESWVQSETIKVNILFGEPYDEERYKKGWYPMANG